MYRIYILTISALIAQCSCKQQNGRQQSNAGTGGTDTLVSTPLYPYPQYIGDQISSLDSLQLGIELVTIQNGITTDSGFISREKFKELAMVFQEPDPNKMPLRSQYEETSFQDLSLNTITFSISTRNPSLPLQRADILLNPNSNEVKYIILKKVENNDSASVSKTLMWVHNMNFQISTSAINNQGKETTSVTKVIWDKPLN